MTDLARTFLESVLDDAQSAQAAENEVEYHKLCDFVAHEILRAPIHVDEMFEEYRQRFGPTRTYNDNLLLAMSESNQA